jgi:hypothetical protein
VHITIDTTIAAALGCCGAEAVDMYCLGEMLVYSTGIAQRYIYLYCDQGVLQDVLIVAVSAGEGGERLLHKFELVWSGVADWSCLAWWVPAGGGLSHA